MESQRFSDEYDRLNEIMASSLSRPRGADELGHLRTQLAEVQATHNAVFGSFPVYPMRLPGFLVGVAVTYLPREAGPADPGPPGRRRLKVRHRPRGRG